MTALLDTRPTGLDLFYRPGNPITVSMNWPADYLDGRTFTVSFGSVTVTGDAMIIEVDGADTEATRSVDFTLTDTTNDDTVVLAGTWVASDKPSVSNNYEVTVTVDSQTVEVSVLESGALAALEVHERTERAHEPLGALARYRAYAAETRRSGKSTMLAVIGDSITEGYNATKRNLRWIEYFARRLNGDRGKVTWVPASSSTFNVQNDWPGVQAPITYSSAPSAAINYGPDMHGVTMVTGSTVTLVFYGTAVTVVYTRTPTGPAAAAVTIDGVSQTPLDAEGTEAVGLSPTFAVDAGFSDYGAHTLVVTSTGAPLTLEGFVVHDGTRFGFATPLDTFYTLGFGHGGFRTQNFVDNTNWNQSVAILCTNALVNVEFALCVIALGVNDIGAGVAASTYRDNLVTIMERVDSSVATLGRTIFPGYLLVMWPGMTDSHVEAAWEAAEEFGTDRCGVVDARRYIPDPTIWDPMSSSGHPNDAGQLWIAEMLADIIDPQAPGWLSFPQNGYMIQAYDRVTTRSSWTESLGVTAGRTYDQSNSSADTTQRERRHRVWLDEGTYQCRVTYEQRTSGGGTIQVLIGSTSLGTQSTSGTDGVITSTTLGTTFTADAPGLYPVTIRKTTTNGLVRFVDLRLRKT